jgi:transposase-like protein
MIRMTYEFRPCLFCTLPTLFRYEVNQKQVWLCLSCRKNLENLNVEIKEVENKR